MKCSYTWGEVVRDNKMLVPGPGRESHIHTKLHKTANKQHEQNRNISSGTGLLAVSGSRQKSQNGAGQSWRLTQVCGEESE